MPAKPESSIAPKFLSRCGRDTACFLVPRLHSDEIFVVLLCVSGVTKLEEKLPCVQLCVPVRAGFL